MKVDRKTSTLKNLKIWIDGAVDDEVDGRIADHEKSSDRVDLVEVDGGDVLPSGLDAEDDQLRVGELVSGGGDARQVKDHERRHDGDGGVRRTIKQTLIYKSNH
jgi:hypothetical protein